MSCWVILTGFVFGHPNYYNGLLVVENFSYNGYHEQLGTPGIHAREEELVGCI
jgi:hypothetical protein